MECKPNDKWKAWGVTALMVMLSCAFLLFLGYRLCTYGG